jgi:hypothetical protein
VFENDETKTWHLSSSWDELFSLTTTKKILSLKNRMMETEIERVTQKQKQEQKKSFKTPKQKLKETSILRNRNIN